MIVVDTNIIARMVFPGDYLKSVGALYEFDPHWEVPVSWRSEFLNVVTHHFHKNPANYPEAPDAIEKGFRLFGNREHEVSAYATTEFIRSSACLSYDFEFVALADRFSVNLITSDKRVLETFPNPALSPKGYIKNDKIKE